MIFPMFAMVLLTVVIGLFAVTARVASVKGGDVKIKYYTLMQGDVAAPEFVTKSTRCFNNQFEIPVIFYVACTLYVSLGIDGSLGAIGLAAAWLFVLFRVIHACIHLTYNNVIHRMAIFWAAVVCVIILWFNLVLHQL